MQRSITEQLIQWKNSPEHLPLLLRGARQVGKTFVVKQFAQDHFEHFVNINFELHPDFESCFSSLEPQEIISRITLKQNVPIIPGKTLLFLDEIQICPKAITALRYFKEKMSPLHVIGAGSLLEFALNDEDFHMPVGRVQYLYLYPLSFREFLLTQKRQNLIAHLQTATIENPPSEVAHQELLKYVKEHFILGGMPAVVDHYIQYHDLQGCQNLQSSLLATYRSDFGKYAKHTQHKYLSAVFNQVPHLIGQQVKYSRIDPDSLSRDLKTALTLLQQAGIIYKVYASSCSGLPLNGLMNEKVFKLLFIDIGLVNRVGKVDISNLLSQDLTLVNQGALSEQWVGQELLAIQNPYEDAELFFWSREKVGSQAEVDYVINIDGAIIPIEVKSGMTGKLRSLKQFLLEKRARIGVQISPQPLGMKDGILSLPFYMIEELPRILHRGCL